MIKIFTKQRKELKTDIDTRIVEYVTYKVGVAIKYQEVKKMFSGIYK